MSRNATKNGPWALPEGPEATPGAPTSAPRPPKHTQGVSEEPPELHFEAEAFGAQNGSAGGPCAR